MLHWYLRNQTIPGGPHRAPLVGSPSTRYRCADQHLLDRKPLCARAGDLRQLPPQPIAQFPRLLGGRRADAQAGTDGGPPGAGHRANCSRVSKTVPAQSGRGRPAPPASSPHPAPTPRGTCRRRRSPSAPAASPSARRPSSVHCPATCDCHARSAARLGRAGHDVRRHPRGDRRRTLPTQQCALLASVYGATMTPVHGSLLMGSVRGHRPRSNEGSCRSCRTSAVRCRGKTGGIR